jgi:hypothetical protein
MSEQEVNTLAGFKKELADLLHKYDAFLGVNVYGDTHNLDYSFYVNLGGGRTEEGWRIGFEHKLKEDSEIQAKDLD